VAVLDTIISAIYESLGYAAVDRASNRTPNRFVSFCAALFCLLVVYCCVLLMINTPIDLVRIISGIVSAFLIALASLNFWSVIKPQRKFTSGRRGE
jgi:hypothetical protein